MEEIVYATPVGKPYYLLGRFAGAYFATATALGFAAVGLLLATFMPWLDAERIAPTDLGPYVWALAVLALPNALFASALLFAVAVSTRSAIATYVGAVFVYVLYFVGAALTNSPCQMPSSGKLRSPEVAENSTSSPRSPYIDQAPNARPYGLRNCSAPGTRPRTPSTSRTSA